MKAILGVVILSFSLYRLLARRPPELKDDRLAWLFGFVAGVLGGAYGINGPPLVIYGTLAAGRLSIFEPRSQGYFLPASLVGLAGYWPARLWVPEVTHFYLLSLPGALAAILLGR